MELSRLPSWSNARSKVLVTVALGALLENLQVGLARVLRVIQ